MLTIEHYACLSDAELSRHDIADYNHAAALGLPGAEILDVDLCRRTLDQMAQVAREKTILGKSAFDRQPAHWDNSFTIFRMHVLMRVLQHDFGVHYNPAKIPEDAVFVPADSFVFGVLQCKTGTCASLPVLYAAVGRRLGYPLKLVSAKQHLFLRWEEAGGERFNVEINNDGFATPPDEHYREGRMALTPKEAQLGCWPLHSQTPRQELACFLHERAGHYRKVGRSRFVAQALALASSLWPDNVVYRELLKQALNVWFAELEQRKPPGFPEISLSWWHRRFPGLPQDLEVQFLGREATELALGTQFEEKWWQPLRRGERPADLPGQIKAEFHSDAGCQLKFMARGPRQEVVAPSWTNTTLVAERD